MQSFVFFFIYKYSLIDKEIADEAIENSLKYQIHNLEKRRYSNFKYSKY